MNKRVLLNIATLTITFIFLFLIIEFGFKVLHILSDAQLSPTTIEGLPYENTANGWFLRYSRNGSWVNYNHNSLNMRDVERTYENTNGSKRILVIGDSVMYGGEVRFKGIFTRQLEGILNNTEVLNLGTSSYSLREYPIYLKAKGLRFSPDLVVLGLCLNDYATLYHTGKKEESDTAKPEYKFKRLLHSYFIEYLQEAYRLIMGEKSIFEHNEVFTKKAWEDNRRYFEELKAICNEGDIKLVVLLLPIGHQFEGNGVADIPQTYIVEILDSLGIPHINPYYNFKEALDNGIVVYRDCYIHFTKEGHRICAEKVAEWLNEEDIWIRQK